MFTIQEYILIGLCIWLSFFGSSLSWTGLNAIFFTHRQIKNSLLFTGITGLLLSTICCCIIYVTETFDFLPQSQYLRIFAGLIMGLIICLMNENLLLNLRSHSTFAFIITVSIIISVFGVMAYFSLYINLILLALYNFFALKDLIANNKKPKTVIFGDPRGKSPETDNSSSLQNGVKFKIFPNVYLFYLESMHSGRAMQIIYNSDSGHALGKRLADMGFTVYPDAYSNYTWTLDTRESVFNMDYTASYTASNSKKDFKPKVIQIFKDNGYKINLFDRHPFVFGHYVNYLDYAYYKTNIPPYILRRIQIFAPLFSQSRLYRLFSKGIDPSEPPSGGKYDECQESAFHQIENISRHERSFNIFYFGPPHTTYYLKTDITPQNWPQTYINNYKASAERLLAYVEHINHYDPNSIVIIMGDHGAHSLDYAWYMKKDFVNQLKKADIDNELLYTDLCSIFMAIKFPPNISLEGFWPCPMNIFPFVFSRLSGDESIYKNRKKEISLLVKSNIFYVIGIHGKAVEKMTPFSSFDFSSIGYATDQQIDSRTAQST